jgi:hypothetical protein
MREQIVCKVCLERTTSSLLHIRTVPYNPPICREKCVDKEPYQICLNHVVNLFIAPGTLYNECDTFSLGSVVELSRSRGEMYVFIAPKI